MKNKKSIKIRSILLATLLILVYLGSMSFVQAAPGDIIISWQDPGKNPGEYTAVTVGDTFRYDLHFDIESISDAWQADDPLNPVEFRPAGIIHYIDAVRGEMTQETGETAIFIKPDAGNISNAEGWFKKLAGTFSTATVNETAGTVANITWEAKKVGIATIYHNISIAAYDGTSEGMNIIRINGEVRVHPQKPSDFIMEDEGSTWFNMSWVTATGIDKFVIFRSEVEEITEPVGSPIYNNTGLFYNDTGLDIEKDYYYSLWGWNETAGFYSLDYETLQRESKNALPSVFTADAISRDTIDLAWDIQGPMKQLILRPNDNAGPNQWTTSEIGDNYEMVNEAVANDDDDYVYTGVTNNEDWYELPTTTINGIIESVTITVRARKEGEDSGVLRTKIRVDSETSESGSITLSETWGTYERTFTKNPLGNDWTFEDINNLDVGIKAHFVADVIYVTQIYATVNYRSVNVVIERSESSEPWAQGAGEEVYNATGLSFSDTELDHGVTYYYQLWTYVDGEYSSTFLQANAKTDENRAPVLSNENPEDATINVDKMHSQVSVQINDPDGDEMTWTIQGEYITNTGDVGGNGTIYADLITPLPYDTIITWYVNVTDGYVWTNETFTFATRDEYLPLNPENFKADMWDRTSINLTWTKVEFGEYVYIERSEVNEPFSRGQGYLVYNNTGTFFDDINLIPGQVYRYQAWSYNVTDNVYSAEFSWDWNTTDSNTPPSVVNETAVLNQEIYTSVYNTYLNITVLDIEGDTLTVTYYWGNHTPIAYNTEVAAGGYWNISIGDYFGPAWRQWLDHDTNYTWYVVVDDGFEVFNSSEEHGLYWFHTSKEFDLNENGIVDVYDISILISSYGMEGHPGELPADIMESGQVDVYDVSRFVSNYGWTHPEYPFE